MKNNPKENAFIPIGIIIILIVRYKIIIKVIINIEAKIFLTKNTNAFNIDMIMLSFSDIKTEVYSMPRNLNITDENMKNKDHILITYKSCLLKERANAFISLIFSSLLIPSNKVCKGIIPIEWFKYIPIAYENAAQIQINRMAPESILKKYPPTAVKKVL